jgi:exportin-5
VMPWAVPQAISSASCVQHMCKSLAASSVAVQLVSTVKFHYYVSR